MRSVRTRPGVAATVVLLAFAVGWFAPSLLAHAKAPSPVASRAYMYGAWTLATLAAVRVLYGGGLRGALRALGLAANPAPSVTMAFVATLPMLVGFAATADEVHLSVGVVAGSALAPGFFEEVFFRGLAFVQLHRAARWGVVPAAAVPAVAFAAGHVGPSSDLAAAFGVFAVTFAGALWFAWIVVAWGFVLWPAVALHVFMNLWWSAFGAGATALGGVGANLLRGATIAIATVWTIRHARRRGRSPWPRGRHWRNRTA